MKKPVMEIRGLDIGYMNRGVREAVRIDMNLSLYPGELVCVIGRNGAGKSTLLRTLAGFSRPLKGEVRLDGKEMRKYSPKELSKRVGVVLTEMIGDIHFMKVREMVAMGRYPYTDRFATMTAEDHRIVSEAICSVGIESLADKRISGISDGERQKVMIAKAIAQQTPVICLDEPLSFLDLPAKVDIMNLLRRLSRDENMAILMSTHDLGLALALADRLWVMRTDGLVKPIACRGLDREELLRDVFGEMASLVTANMMI